MVKNSQQRIYKLNDEAARLANHFEFLFELYPDSIFKHGRKCLDQTNSQYGLSWEEELGWDGKTFIKFYRQIGVHYHSWEAFEKAKKNGNEFRRRFYCSVYVEGDKRRTYYYRNNTLDAVIKAVLQPDSTINNQLEMALIK
jgi:hypothetical protein